GGPANESVLWSTCPLTVRVFSQPQKMVFDCVYGRLTRRRLRQPLAFCTATVVVTRATARHYITGFEKSSSDFRCQMSDVFLVSPPEPCVPPRKTVVPQRAVLRSACVHRRN